jgi:hypothetical protein
MAEQLLFNLIQFNSVSPTPSFLIVATRGTRLGGEAKRTSVSTSPNEGGRGNLTPQLAKRPLRCSQTSGEGAEGASEVTKEPAPLVRALKSCLGAFLFEIVVAHQLMLRPFTAAASAGRAPLTRSERADATFRLAPVCAVDVM